MLRPSSFQQVAREFANPPPGSTKVSSGFSQQPDQKNLVRRGEEATLNLFLHNWPCVWSLGWKTLCLIKSNQNSLFNLGEFFPLMLLYSVFTVGPSYKIKHAHLERVSDIKHSLGALTCTY